MNEKLKIIIMNLVIFIIMGSIYCTIELFWRGYSDKSMFFVGGICGLIIGLLNEITPQMELWKQCILSSIIVTLFEFAAGCILNLWLKLNIWDYSSMPFNLLGQICLPYSILWLILSIPAIKLDDFIRHDKY